MVLTRTVSPLSITQIAPLEKPSTNFKIVTKKKA